MPGALQNRADPEPIRYFRKNVTFNNSKRHATSHVYDGEFGKMNCTIGQFNMQGKLVASYPGAAEAAIRMGGSRVDILMAAIGHLKVYEGYAWRFAE